MFRNPHLIAMTILSFSFWLAANAQSISITGSVVDNGTSAGIANAKVSLVEVPSCTTRTDANGGFTLSGGTSSAILPQKKLSASAYHAILSGSCLLVNAGTNPAGITVDAFTVNGKRIFHEKRFAAGQSEFSSLWKNPGLYFVKVQIGSEVRMMNSLGSNQSIAFQSPENNSLKELAKISAMKFTIEAGKSGYDSKQVSMNATSGSAGTIRLSPYSQAPGTWKNVSPMANPDIEGVVCDPVRKSDCWLFLDYASQRNVRGVWKSTDYGATWAQCNTGTNGDQLNNGCPWYVDIDHNPNRDPATSPTMYAAQGYGSGGIWKSVDGGVSWTQVWNTNIYNGDGVTKISVDNFLTGALIISPSSPDHLFAFHHNGGYGIFESKDGGGKWVQWDNTKPFNIGAHSARPIPIDESTWIVNLENSGGIQRTTNGGATWSLASGTMTPIAGRSTVVCGSTIYAGSQTYCLYKSTDKGASWKSIRSDWCGWVAASATRLYTITSPCVAGSCAMKFRSALISNDAVWDSMPSPDANKGNTGECAVSTFDGTHWIILGTCRTSGIYRYVEP